MTQPPKNISQHFREAFFSLGILVGIMWVLETLNWSLPGLQLDAYGIHPQNPRWLVGIVLAPFLHGSWTHLMANTPPFLLFGGLIVLRSVKEFWLVTIISMLISGLGVWLISPIDSVTVGASGVIFGYLGFLLLDGFFKRKILSIAISLGVGFFYGSLIWQALPSAPNVSWQAHLFGLIGGILAASFLSPRTINNKG
ncbi:rhomboid family intramembrane serine protease [Crocosphaera sp. Alani8]|uniref:rhomboid family intramembrane serine protease n=1 Tax=Crocosphaera sp. Alani8 TaxID=3038952 RepID=UPI00313CB381